MSAPGGYVSPSNEADPMRPHSVRILELQSLRKARPYTAANRAVGSANRGLKSKKEVDRARPKLIQYRKEDLYDERMALKTKANELAEENLRLKTRIKFLEKETRRGDEAGDSLLSVVKTQCKDLKAKLDEKESELCELKQSIKVTRATEIQVELKAYVDECTRLRRMVEESAEQLTMGVAPTDLQQRYLQLLVDFKALSREYRMTVNTPEELKGRKSSLKEQSVKANATLFELREENIALKDQNRGLLGELGRLHQTAMCPNCQQPLFATQGNDNEVMMQRPVALLFHMLWARMRDVGFDVKTLWQKLDSEMSGVLRPEHIESGFSHMGIPVSPPELSQLMSELHPEQGTRVHFAQFERTLMKYSLDPEALPAPVLQALMTLAWQCQVSRVRKEELPALVTTGAECTAEDLVKSFQQVPFSLSLEDSTALMDFLLQGKQSQPSHVISVWLDLLLPFWDVFTEDEEAELDRTLMQLFHGKYDQFLQLCQQRDGSGSQYITFTEFMEVCEELGVRVEGAVGSYLQVEFYSETKNVDKVPYQSVAQLYCGGGQEAEAHSA